MAYELITGSQKEKWNTYVKKSLQYDYYHTWQYHSMAEEGKPILFKYSEKEDFIAFPLIKRNIPNSRFFDMTSVYGYTGPISNKRTGDISESMKNNFKDGLLRYLREENVVSVFSRLNPFLDQLPLMKNLEGIHDNGKIVVINLRQSIEKQRSRYKHDVFSKINRLKNQGFHVKMCKNSNEIKQFAAIYSENMKRVSAQNFYMFSEEYFHTFLNSSDFRSELVMVYHEDTPVCGATIVFTQKIIQSHLLGTTTNYLKFAPAKLITDEISIIGREQGMHYLNLGGGLGFKEDSLFDFKTSFSDQTLDFKTWRYIADQKTYNNLLQGLNIDSDTDVDFFPLYRYRDQ
jgi:hypothetical protein